MRYAYTSNTYACKKRQIKEKSGVDYDDDDDKKKK